MLAPKSNKTTRGVELKVSISITIVLELSAYFMLIT